MSIFAGKTLMITGGTGSFGNAVLNRFLRTDIDEIRHMQTQTKDALTRLFQKGNISFGSVKDVRGSFYWRCTRLAVVQECHARRRLHLPRCCPEAGTKLRVLPHGSSQN